MNRPQMTQNIPVGHQPYGVHPSHQAHQVFAQQQLQAHANAVHNWRETQRMWYEKVFRDAIFPDVQQLVDNLTTKSDEHRQDLSETKDKLSSTLESISGNLNSYQDNLSGELKGLRSDLQAAQNSDYRISLNFQEEIRRLQARQESYEREISSRIDQLEQSLLLQLESIPMKVTQLIERENKNTPNQNTNIDLRKQDDAQLQIIKWFVPSKDEPRMTTRSHRKSIGDEQNEPLFVQVATKAIIKAVSESLSNKAMCDVACGNGRTIKREKVASAPKPKSRKRRRQG